MNAPADRASEVSSPKRGLWQWEWAWWLVFTRPFFFFFGLHACLLPIQPPLSTTHPYRNMPKVKASKSRVHHKAVGGKEAVAASVVATPKPVATTESMQQMKEQFGLEFEDDKVDKKDKRKMRHDKWMSST